MDTAPWPQEMLGLMVKPNNMEETNNNNNNNNTKPQQMAMERRLVRPQKEQALNCPRCNSTNTKFCYYNNYSLTQPRYFCKGCRRYWTEGGSLRNVPVGGGSRKNHHNPTPNNSNNKRSSSASSSSTTASSSNSTAIISSKAKLVTHENRSQLIPGAQDLNLDDFNAHASSAADVPAAINPFVMMHSMALPPTYPSNAFLPLDNVGNVNGGFMMQESAARVLFPFEEARQSNILGGSNNSNRNGNGNGGDHDKFEQNKGFWSGMMGGGGGGSW